LEAYQGFMKHYTLLGPDRNLIERAFSKSVLTTKIYLGAILAYKNLRVRYWHVTQSPGDLSLNHELSKMDSLSVYHQIPVLFTTIPSPENVQSGEDLNKRYKEYFKEISFVSPSVSEFSINDYDGPNDDNHFIESGHAKYAAFLEYEIDKALSGQ
jgi:hypothetical protein